MHVTVLGPCGSQHHVVGVTPRSIEALPKVRNDENGQVKMHVSMIEEKERPILPVLFEL